MRHSLLLIPGAILLSVATAASQDLVSPAARVVVGRTPADTGDSAAGKGARSHLGLRCPMPVLRPDPGTGVTLPAGREYSMPGAMLAPGGIEAGIAAMPVARADCWNPLDRPRGDRDSAVIDTVHQH